MKADVAWQGSNKVFVMEMSNQAHNSGLFPKCRSSLFWLSFLSGILLPKEKALELINCTQRLGLCGFSLGKNHSSYGFLHYLPSLAVKDICTPSFAVKIKNSMCFCHRCIAFKLMLFSTSISSAIYFSPVSIIINLHSLKSSYVRLGRPFQLRLWIEVGSTLLRSNSLAWKKQN